MCVNANEELRNIDFFSLVLLILCALRSTVMLFIVLVPFEIVGMRKRENGHNTFTERAISITHVRKPNDIIQLNSIE